jgi:hypothetical protein
MVIENRFFGSTCGCSFPELGENCNPATPSDSIKVEATTKTLNEIIIPPFDPDLS